MKVFVAGATGAIGRPLVTQLLAAGHQVTGMTRTPEKGAWLEERGATAVVVDALDSQAVTEAVRQAEPEVVVDELTDLPKRPNVYRFNRFYDRQTKLKERAPGALLDAAVAVEARRHIMQSVAFIYASGGDTPKSEDDLLFTDPPAPWDSALPPFFASEQRVSESPELVGIVLRYGFFYGPGTHMAKDGWVADDVRRRRYPIVGDGGGVHSFIHVSDGAAATVKAVERGLAGIYNVVDDCPIAVRDWLPLYADALGAKPPRRVSKLLARLATGPVPTHFGTTLSGASNAKAVATLEWKPGYPSVEVGFFEALG